MCLNKQGLWIAAMKIKTVVETAIYAEDLEAAEAFYTTVLGLPVRGKEAGHHVFFHVGESSVLLVFRAEATLKGDHLPPHGATGSGHFALGIEAGDYDAWRRHLESHGVMIEKEVDWPRGGKYLYCRDPENNLVEPGIWGLPSGW